MSDERGDEPAERPRPRVVDRRVSARAADAAAEPAAETPAGGAERTEPIEAPAAAGAEAPPRQTPPESPPPGGEQAASGPQGEPPPGRVWTPEQEAEIQRLAREIAERPGLDWVVNSALNLVNVAGTKIEMGQAQDAQIAIDALAGLLQGVSGRLESAEQPLRQALAELQLAFARQVAPSPGEEGPGTD